MSGFLPWILSSPHSGTSRGRVSLLLNSDYHCSFSKGGNHIKSLRDYFISIFPNISSRELQGVSLVMKFKPKSNWLHFLEYGMELSLGSCR